MNSFKLTYALFIAAITLLAACAEEEDQAPKNVNANDINSLISQMPGWQLKTVQQLDPVLTKEVTVTTNSVPYKCAAYEKHLVRELQNITSVETNFGIVWPGALIQGSSLETGELQPIPAKRAPVTVQTDLAIDHTFKEVDKPNSVSIQQAIAEFQIAAGQMPEGSQAGAGLMNFVIEEVASFRQAMLAIGISGGFTEPQSSVGLEASASVSLERSYTEHTVIAKFVQEMFTVRLADDLLPTPADFFDSEMTLSDFEELEAKGIIGEENIPLYIESVTYGRIMLFTMKSTETSSAQELSAALNASMQDYLNGGASLTDAQKNILSKSSVTVFSAGGTKEAANSAIANLNWSEFFKAAPATTAVPISFVAKTLNGKKIVKIVDNVKYEQRDNCKEPYAYEVSLQLDKVQLESGTCVNCSYSSSVRENGAWIADPIESGKILLGGNVVKIIGSGKYATGMQQGSTFDIQSAISGLWVKSQTTSFAFPFPEINVGKTTKRDHLLTESGRSVRFSYSLTKTPKYD